MAYLVVLLVLLAVVYVVSAPLRAPRALPDELTAADASRIRDLEAAREAKYRELRDAELDHSTGKLSDDDYEAIDQTLRAEAIEILRELDDARA
jgi:flagellar biosynthesis/type III secretory pathway M-ring protein FliF/YscJ